jgi:hypothetical protein
MKLRHIISSIVIAFLAFPLSEAFAQITINVLQTYDYPGASQTRPQKINDGNNIVGIFLDASGVSKGFVRFADGTFSDPIVDPNDTGSLTEARGNNNSNLICGDYLTSDGVFHGFFLRGTHYQNFDISSTFSIVLGLNNVGDSVGSFVDDTSGVQEGFSDLGGTVTPVVVPGAANTLCYGLNASNTICGYFTDSAGLTHGFFVDRNGRLHSPIDPAGSTGTIVFGNNDKNWIVGRYSDSTGVTHAYILVPPDQFVIFDYPGSTFTSFNGINRKQFISGRYTDSAGIDHGFVARAIGMAENGATEINIKSSPLPAKPATQSVPRVVVPAM